MTHKMCLKKIFFKVLKLCLTFKKEITARVKTQISCIKREEFFVVICILDTHLVEDLWDFLLPHKKKRRKWGCFNSVLCSIKLVDPVFIKHVGMKACILLVKANNSKYQKYGRETPEIFLHQFIYLLTRVHGSSKMSRVLQVCWQKQDFLLAHFVKRWGVRLTSDNQYRFRYPEDSLWSCLKSIGCLCPEA